MVSLAWKALLVWAAIVPIAILNGVFRESVLSPLLGARAALPLSGFLLALLILGLTWIALPWFGMLDARQYGFVGAGWLALTVAFEFGFGLFVADKSWNDLLVAYDISSGNLWPAVLVVTAVAPWTMAKLRGRI